MVKCLTAYCRFPSTDKSDYCFRCADLERIEEEQRKEDVTFDYSVLCIVCGKRTLLTMTEKTYIRLREWPLGSRCGWCGSVGLEWGKVDRATVGSSMNGTHTMMKRL